MNIGQWYIQRFSDETLYFLPVAEQKNRGYSGVLVRVDETRPRARPRATKSSVGSGPYGSAAHWSVLWKPASDVPVRVEETLADRFPAIAMAKGVMSARDRRRRPRRDPQHSLEILSVNRRHPNGIQYVVRVPTTKVRRGYDLVDVIFHDNGATSTKSANRLTTTGSIAARFAREHGPSYQPGRSRLGMHGI